MDFKEGDLATEFKEFIDKIYTNKMTQKTFPDKPTIIFENQERENNSNMELPWLTFSAQVVYGSPASLGEYKKMLRKGVIVITINTPSGTLTYNLQKLTELIVQHYECQKICDVYIRDINVTDKRQTDEVWYSRALIISFDYYIIKNIK